MNNAKSLLQYYQSLLDCMDIDREQLYVHVSNHIYLNQARDLRTKTGWIKTDRTRPGPREISKPGIGPDGGPWIPEPDIAV